jgi:hypothetical protein
MADMAETVPGVTGPTREAALAALETGYATITAAVSGLGGAEMMRPSRCAGWAVADVLYHQFLDAFRALQAFATPAGGPPDRDYVSYWREFSPAGGDPPGGEGAAEHARFVRVAASAHRPATLARLWAQTAGAACRAARACPHPAVATQGHVLALPDFLATLVTEAAVHYLDLTVELPGAPVPDPAGLALVRRVLAGLLAGPLPGTWEDATAALKGTGREPLSEADRALLGPAAARFPLFG